MESQQQQEGGEGKKETMGVTEDVALASLPVVRETVEEETGANHDKHSKRKARKKRPTGTTSPQLQQLIAPAPDREREMEKDQHPREQRKRWNGNNSQQQQQGQQQPTNTAPEAAPHHRQQQPQPQQQQQQQQQQQGQTAARKPVKLHVKRADKSNTANTTTVTATTTTTATTSTEAATGAASTEAAAAQQTTAATENTTAAAAAPNQSSEAAPRQQKQRRQPKQRQQQQQQQQQQMTPQDMQPMQQQQQMGRGRGGYRKQHFRGNGQERWVGGQGRGAYKYPQSQQMQMQMHGYGQQQGYAPQWYGNGYGQQMQQPVVYLDRDSVRSFLQQKLEFYMSKDNLVRDQYLRQHMDPRSGFIPLRIFATFPSMANYMVDMSVMTEAARSSKVVEVDQSGQMARPSTFDWSEFIPKQAPVTADARPSN